MHDPATPADTRGEGGGRGAVGGGVCGGGEWGGGTYEQFAGGSLLRSFSSLLIRFKAMVIYVYMGWACDVDEGEGGG